MRNIHLLNFVLMSVCLVTEGVTLLGCSQSQPGQVMVSSGSPRLFQERSIGRFGLRGTMQVALTYDDGPVPPATGDLLDYLAQEKIAATFFIIGEHAEQYPQLMERISREGHVLGNHTEHHIPFSRAAFAAHPELAAREISDADHAIRPYVSPTQRHLYFRAPEGAWRFSIADILNSITEMHPYIGPVFWDAGGELQPAPKRGQRYFVTPSKIQSAADWDCWAHKVDVRTCAAGYLKEILAYKGGVVLMHAINENSVQMSRILIPELRKLGYQFVTLDEVPNLDPYADADILRSTH